MNLLYGIKFLGLYYGIISCARRNRGSFPYSAIDVFRRSYTAGTVRFYSPCVLLELRRGYNYFPIRKEVKNVPVLLKEIICL